MSTFDQQNQQVRTQINAEHVTVNHLPYSPPSQSPLHWTVPYLRNPLFTGREEILSQLHISLTTNNATALTQAISGLGGIGKTQTALEYTYRYYSEYQAIFWVRASSREEIIEDFINIARLLQLPEQYDQDQQHIVKATKYWLQTNTKWLLIIDNADEPRLVKEYLPTSRSGHILLTTRFQAMRSIAHTVELMPMPFDEGIIFLLRRAGFLNFDSSLEHISIIDRLNAESFVQALKQLSFAPDKSRAFVDENLEAAMQIAQEMDGLPLALDQAGAFVEETGCSLTEYLQLYQQRKMELLEERGGIGVGADYPESIATTWSLSFQKVKQISPVADELLCFCSFLHPDSISEEILRKSASYLSTQFQEAIADPMIWYRVIEALRSYSLIRRNAANNMLNVHRLVQVVLKEKMDLATQQEWAKRTVKAIGETFPSARFQNWDSCQQYLLHVELCLTYVDRYQLHIPEIALLLNQAGWYLVERARYNEADTLLQRALNICKNASEPEDVITIAVFNNIASLYMINEKYAEAEAFLEQALIIIEKIGEDETPMLSMTLNSLARAYFLQGKYTKALTFFQRALTIHEKTLGPEHEETATTLDNLAQVHRVLYQYTEAEELFLRALTIREKVLGSETPKTATTLGNLAYLYALQGQYAKAEPLYHRSLAIVERELSSEHPEVAAILNNLALIFIHQEKYAQAEDLLLRSLTIRKEKFGLEHSSTVNSMVNLADLYRIQGQYDRAEMLFLQALNIQEKILGFKNLESSMILNNLGFLYLLQEKYDEAESLFLRSLTLEEEIFGATYLGLTTTLSNLARLYLLKKEYQKAEPLFIRVLSLVELKHSSDPSDIANILNCLGLIYYYQELYGKAKSFFQRALAIIEKALGSGHPASIEILNNLGYVYFYQGLYIQAASFLRRSLSLKEKIEGPQSIILIPTLEQYADLFFKMGQIIDALKLQQRINVIKSRNS